MVVVVVGVVGGLLCKRWKKEKVKRGVSLAAAALQNHHMGHADYPPFLRTIH